MNTLMENTMLVVDDMEMNREIIKVLFHDSFVILEAENGEEALDVLQGCQGNIDIVLLDLIMPDLNGFDLLEKREELDYFKDVPVVVITSSGHMEDQIRAFEMGASDFVIKPFVPEVVISRVNNVIAAHQKIASIEMEAQKLKVKSELDEMTGLYNKTTSEIAMNEVLKINEPGLNVLMVIDIDNFKTVNDTLGHQTGDHVIKIVADLISSHFRKSDIVGRIGGDEFAVMMVDVPSMDIVYEKVNELIQTMKYKPNLTIPEYVTLSIGMASNEGCNTTYMELFQQADEALYEAKQEGKARYRMYGIAPIDAKKDDRPIVLLFSTNRNVTGIIHSLVPPQLKVSEVSTQEELANYKRRERVLLTYIDVSNIEGDTTAYWNSVKKCDWLNMDNTFAICQEGDLTQYKSAIMSGVADLFTAPVDGEAFKRRMIRQLEKIRAEK